MILTGGSGFVGRHLRNRVALRGIPLTLVSRRQLDLLPNERLVVADLTTSDSVATELPRGSVVVNLAYDAGGDSARNLTLAEAVATLCRDVQAARLVHLSTAMVVGPIRGTSITEDTQCRPVTPYQQSKLAVERRLATSIGDVPLVVLRPSAVFGPGGLNLQKLARDLALRPSYENYVRACLFGGRRMHLVPVETVVAAVEFAAHCALLDRQTTWFVTDDENPGNVFWFVERTLREALGQRRRVMPIRLPPWALQTVLRVTGRLSLDPRATFSRASLNRAGFVAPISFTEALLAYASQLVQDPLREVSP